MLYLNYTNDEAYYDHTLMMKKRIAKLYGKSHKEHSGNIIIIDHFVLELPSVPPSEDGEWFRIMSDDGDLLAVYRQVDGYTVWQSKWPSCIEDGTAMPYLKWISHTNKPSIDNNNALQDGDNDPELKELLDDLAS